MTADLSFALAARSKIWTVLDWALSAMTCLDQCMIALSALIGLWMTSLFFLRSIIMTCGLSSSLSFCRTQTNWSDSNVCRIKVSAIQICNRWLWDGECITYTRVEAN